MKIAIPAISPTLDSPLAERLRRAPYIIILTTRIGTVEVVENSEKMYLREDAGHQMAQELSARRVDYLQAKYVGPKAYQVLYESDIKVGTLTSVTCGEP